MPNRNLRVADLVASGVPIPYAQAIYSWVGQLAYDHEITLSTAEVEKLYELLVHAQGVTGPDAEILRRWITHVPVGR